MKLLNINNYSNSIFHQLLTIPFFPGVQSDSVFRQDKRVGPRKQQETSSNCSCKNRKCTYLYCIFIHTIIVVFSFTVVGKQLIGHKRVGRETRDFRYQQDELIAFIFGKQIVDKFFKILIYYNRLINCLKFYSGMTFIQIRLF